jgi:3-isopropylmalate/(R)-2-methylmalate dehydratase small subunit
VTLPGDEVADLIHLATARPGAAAAVDLELQVVETSEGREIPFAIEPGIRERLLNGWDDIALSLAHEEEIARYEREAERDGPVTTRFA